MMIWRATIPIGSSPAWVFPIGLTRLFYVLDEQGLLNPELPSAPCDELVLPMTDDPAPAIALAEAPRSGGIRVQLYGEKKKFKQKLSYADKLGVPFVVLLGEDEIAENKCSVRICAPDSRKS